MDTQPQSVRFAVLVTDMSDKKKFTEDEVIQDPGPLHVPYVELRYMQNHWITLHDSDALWRRVKAWFDSKFPHVLWQVGYYDKSKKDFLSSRIYFQTRELYVEFCQEFPEFLRGDDES